MRQAIANAEVGDEQLGEDPDTNRLQSRIAKLFNKEAALLLPSGSMANKTALAALTKPGDNVLCDRWAHIHRWEAGGGSIMAGVGFHPIDSEDGHPDAIQIEAEFSAGDLYRPRTSLVALEQTHNFAGGTVWALDRYESATAMAHELGANVLVDGARLMNAVVASGIHASTWAAPADLIWIDLSKGLGGPFGAVLAGSAEVIATANRWKYIAGGAMRQSGIIAAAGLYALDHNIERLADDHARAQRLARGLGELGCSVSGRIDTNLVYFDPAPTGLGADTFVAQLREHSIAMGMVGSRVRAVTHLDVDDQGIDDALTAARQIIERAS